MAAIAQVDCSGTVVVTITKGEKPSVTPFNEAG